MAELTASLIVLILLGLSNASYLAWKHFRREPLACPINSNCNAVTDSKWASIFGIRNEALGVSYYILILIISVLWLNDEQAIYGYLLIAGGAGALAYSAFLVYVQKYIIRNYCFYCLISALINLLIFINEIFLVYGEF